MSFKLLNDCSSIPNIDHEISVNANLFSDELLSILTPKLSADAEMSFECELGPGSAKLFGLDLSNGSDIAATSVIFKSSYQVQIRRHKKKRINKKWNKKFGPRYIMKFKACQLESVQFNQVGPELTIVGERARFLTPNDPLYI